MPPLANGTRWPAVRSDVLPQMAQTGEAAMTARAIGRSALRMRLRATVQPEQRDALERTPQSRHRRRGKGHLLEKRGSEMGGSHARNRGLTGVLELCGTTPPPWPRRGSITGGVSHPHAQQPPGWRTAAHLVNPGTVPL